MKRTSANDNSGRQGPVHDPPPNGNTEEGPHRELRQVLERQEGGDQGRPEDTPGRPEDTPGRPEDTAEAEVRASTDDQAPAAGDTPLPAGGGGTPPKKIGGVNITDLRLPQNMAELGVQKIITTIPVRKPGRQEYIRTRRGSDYIFETGVLVVRDDRDDVYLVSSNLWDSVPDIKPMALRAVINRQGVLSVWPLRLPGVDGRLDPWADSALAAAALAEKEWISVRSNRSLGAYEAFVAAGKLPEPEWPRLTMDEILDIAFRGRVINLLDHPVLRKLRGEV